ncbi:MAG: hypothetical protein WCE21_04800 [Candidatus Babeliales bacterium]
MKSMSLQCIRVCVYILCLSMAQQIQPASITMREGGGCDRLGDHLVLLLKTLWLSYKYQIPFVCKPFKGSHYFTIHEQMVQRKKKTSYKHTIHCLKEATIASTRAHDYAYGVDFNCIVHAPSINRFQLFRAYAQELLQPVVPVPLLKRDDAIAIAVHIRKGSGADTGLLSIQQFPSKPTVLHISNEPLVIQEPNYTNAQVPQRHSPHMDINFPLRFAPEQYYIDQIKCVAHLFPDQLLDLFIFTDAAEPHALLERIRANVDDNRMQWYVQEQSSDGQWAVVRDLFLMAQCDCLIRARSHLAHVAEFLGNHQLVLFPRAYRWHHHCLYITDVALHTADKGIIQRAAALGYLAPQETSAKKKRTRVRRAYEQS